VSNHADNPTWAKSCEFGSDRLIQRITVFEIHLGEDAIDHGDAWGLGVVFRGEKPSAKQRYSHRLEVVRAGEERR